MLRISKESVLAAVIQERRSPLVSVEGRNPGLAQGSGRFGPVIRYLKLPFQN